MLKIAVGQIRNHSILEIIFHDQHFEPIDSSVAGSKPARMFPTFGHEIMNRSLFVRVGLGVAAISILIAGQLIPPGLLYIQTAVGLLAIVTSGLGNIYLGMALAGIILPVMFITAGASVFCCVIPVIKSQSTQALSLAAVCFATLSVLFFVGLTAASVMLKRHNQGWDVPSYYFTWPVLFGLLAFCYRIAARSASRPNHATEPASPPRGGLS